MMQLNAYRDGEQTHEIFVVDHAQALRQADLCRAQGCDYLELLEGDRITWRFGRR